jgi:hypothetical protein
MGQGSCNEYFWFGRQPKLRLWIAATNRHLGYPRCTANNAWRFVEVHYQNVAVNVCFTLLPKMAASTLVMDSSYHVHIQLPSLQFWNLLKLCWCTFSSWGREPATNTFDLEGCQYLVYEYLQPIVTWVTQDAQPEIVDTPWNLIFRMGQWMCCLLCCQKGPPAWLLWLAPTSSPFHYRTYTTENDWWSTDTTLNVQCSQDLMQLIIALLIIWTLWMPFSVIRNWLHAKAEPSNIPAVVTLIQSKSIC